MVKEKKHTILFVAIPAIFIVYGTTWLQFPRLFILFTGTLCLFSLMTGILTFSDTPTLRLVRLVCFGLLVGLIAQNSISRHAHPLISLAPRNRIAVVTGELVSDPTPIGTEFYHSTIKTRSLETGSGNQFSATGQAELFFPQPW